MTQLSFDRIPRILPELERALQDKPELARYLQDLVVFLYEWRAEVESQLASAGGSLTVKEEGVAVGTSGGITSIDFVGSLVTATGSGAAATVTVVGDGTGTGGFDWGKDIASRGHWYR